MFGSGESKKNVFFEKLFQIFFQMYFISFLNFFSSNICLFILFYFLFFIYTEYETTDPQLSNAPKNVLIELVLVKLQTDTILHGRFINSIVIRIYSLPVALNTTGSTVYW